MSIHVDLRVVPVGVGVSTSDYIAACARVLDEAGLRHHVHSDGTNIEGDWAKVFAAIRHCHEVMHDMGAPRLSTTIHVDSRTDRVQSLSDRIHSVTSKVQG